MGKSTGGILIAFAGTILLIGAVKGTLGKVWAALWDTTPAQASNIGNPVPLSQAEMQSIAQSIENNPLAQHLSVGNLNYQNSPPAPGTPGSGVVIGATP